MKTKKSMSNEYSRTNRTNTYVSLMLLFDTNNTLIVCQYPVCFQHSAFLFLIYLFTVTLLILNVSRYIASGTERQTVTFFTAKKNPTKQQQKNIFLGTIEA